MNFLSLCLPTFSKEGKQWRLDTDALYCRVRRLVKLLAEDPKPMVARLRDRQQEGVETILIEELAPSLQRRVYLTNHATHPLVWEMYFYKAKSGWLPDQMQFRDTYELLGSKK